MNRFLPPESCCPFTIEQTGLVNADLVGESRLERALPVVLEFVQPVLGAATEIAHPAEILGEKFADVANAVVIQAVNHALDDCPGFTGFGGIVVFCKDSLFGSGASHAAVSNSAKRS